MEYIKLGKTPYTVSRICFGALTIGPLGACLPVEEGAGIIRRGLEQGINFIDTAECYGTYPHIRRALKGWHRPVIIASKSYTKSEAGLWQAVEAARKALDRDMVEIFLLHEIPSAEDLLSQRPLLDYLHKLKAQGRIGAVGISTHHAGVAALCAQLEEIEVLHPLINKAGIGINGGSREEMEAALIQAHRRGIGIYGMKSMGGGSLMLQAREMQQWALSRPYLHSVAMGMKDKAEVATNIGWYKGENPPEAEEVKLLRRQLVFDACLGCGTCCRACSQKALVLENNYAVWQEERCIYCGYCIPACPHFFISFA